MIIDLNSFGREKIYQVVIPADEIDLELGNQRIVGDVAFSAAVTKGAAATSVIGQIKGSIELDCDRCLEPVTTPIDIPVELEFVPVDQFSSDSERELTAEDLNIDAFDGESLDFKGIVREQIVLEIPQQFFCKADCKGLCAKCGSNLNLIDCNCKESEIDPRWAALQNLK